MFVYVCARIYLFSDAKNFVSNLSRVSSGPLTHRSFTHRIYCNFRILICAACYIYIFFFSCVLSPFKVYGLFTPFEIECFFHSFTIFLLLLGKRAIGVRKKVNKYFMISINLQSHQWRIIFW